MSQAIPRDRLPAGFETSLWAEQLHAYNQSWYDWRGKVFTESTGIDSETKLPVLKYPLKINLLRAICRIHNAMLWGESRDPNKLVRTRVRARPSFATGKADEGLKKRAQIMERVVDRVQEQFTYAALLYSAGPSSQYMGGSYLQLRYEPESGAVIPFFIRGIRPDFVLPIADPQGPWRLLECFVIYRLNAAKTLTTAGMKKIPAGIDALYSQLSRYKYPEDRKDRQDVVMAFSMSAWWLQRLYFMQVAPEQKDYEAITYDVRNRSGRSIPSRSRIRH